MTFCFTRWSLAATCVILLLIGPAGATAQTASGRWPGLSPSGLETIYLLDRSGMETSGKLLGLDAESLVLLVDGTERRFDRADVARLQKRDSLKNGTLIGAAVGVGLGLLAAGISDCPGSDPGGSCGGFRAVTFATSVGIYSAIGARVDALIRGRTTIYAAPPTATTRATNAASSARAGIQVHVRW